MSCYKALYNELFFRNLLTFSFSYEYWSGYSEPINKALSLCLSKHHPINTYPLLTKSHALKSYP